MLNIGYICIFVFSIRKMGNFWFSGKLFTGTAFLFENKHNCTCMNKLVSVFNIGARYFVCLSTRSDSYFKYRADLSTVFTFLQILKSLMHRYRHRLML